MCSLACSYSRLTQRQHSILTCIFIDSHAIPATPQRTTLRHRRIQALAITLVSRHLALL